MEPVWDDDMHPGNRAARVADAVLETSVIGGFSRIGAVARRALFRWDDEPRADLHGRVALVAGATSGIGAASARALARLGAEVWITGRDRERLDAARAQMVATATGGVHAELADHAALNDVRRLATRLADSVGRLDVLVHNAGVLTHDLVTTADGLELTAQVHVVAPFLLTSLLLPVLTATDDARVITVSSGGMYLHALDVDRLDRPATPFDGTRAYANAKRAQVVLNEMWSRAPAASGVAFHAMHPGWADTPGVRTALPRFRSLLRPVLRSADEGADTVVWLATINPGPAGGRFWHDRRARAVAPLPRTATSANHAEQLWDWCAQRSGAPVLAPVVTSVER